MWPDCSSSSHPRAEALTPFCRQTISAVVIFSALLLTVATIGAEEPPMAMPVGDADVEFLRLKRDDRQRLESLDVAIVHCVPRAADKRAPTVDLIAAVHVAEPEFYAELNKRFADYDAVLYELVAPEGTRVQRGRGKANHPVSAVQHGLTDLLELQFQLEGIDYQADNLVHADMSPEQLAESMQQRGESFAKMFMRMLGYAMARSQQSAGNDARTFAALFAEDRTMSLRRAMAEQFEDMPAMVRAIDGPNGSTLLAQRNKKALEVLRKQIADGKKRVAIFYGAAHMDDMLERLEKDFALKPATIEWCVAWKLSE
jgi:hypothetical protein